MRGHETLCDGERGVQEVLCGEGERGCCVVVRMECSVCACT